MIHSKKAIGFLYGVGFLTILFFFFKTIPTVSFSDFSLFEWQLKQVLKGSLHLPYLFITTDPNLDFFPLPNVFFHLTNNSIDSTFPNLYPILFSPFYWIGGKTGIQLIQFILFFLVIRLFFLIKRDHSLSLILLFGSSIPIYTNLIHDTIFIFFLEVLLLYIIHKQYVFFASLLSVFLLWMRPEFVFVICLLPFYFEWKNIWKQYLKWFVLFIFLFLTTNFILYSTVFPLRLFKNSTYHWNLEIVVYLFRLLIEQIPAFTIFLILSVISIFQKKIKLQNLILFLFTCLIILSSPNTGGHNTPRYLFCLVPFYVLSFHSNLYETLHRKNVGILLVILLTIYSIYQWQYQTKELIKISKFQSNTLASLNQIPEQTIVFNNSDFSFVALPLIEQNKNLFLLKKNPEENAFGAFLAKNHIKSFVFVELPPSPYPIPNPLVIPNYDNDCEFRFVDQYPLPNAMLPIMVTRYQRVFP
ncbi:LA_3751/LA_3752 family putative glycosyltransferase [Leptospira paudalimensis]|uniref:Glycosyltransferase RgtA/B/C/D-like domain-containing protein n=1 Tax=Leptospira paudalimensis TaxID=2950024 RepID=A0ABT3M3S9_9LEPT|nr:hypothetical protein [Leptospira paudalimensis]MCW7503047.1 hypothetical protein [Leptospira paudalimensis]